MATIRAYDIMTKDVLTVTPDMSKDAARGLLFEHGVHGVPVVDHAGRLETSGAYPSFARDVLSASSARATSCGLLDLLEERAAPAAAEREKV